MNVYDTTPNLNKYIQRKHPLLGKIKKFENVRTELHLIIFQWLYNECIINYVSDYFSANTSYILPTQFRYVLSTERSISIFHRKYLYAPLIILVCKVHEVKTIIKMRIYLLWMHETRYFRQIWKLKTCSLHRTLLYEGMSQCKVTSTFEKVFMTVLFAFYYFLRWNWVIFMAKFTATIICCMLV